MGNKEERTKRRDEKIIQKKASLLERKKMPKVPGTLQNKTIAICIKSKSIIQIFVGDTFSNMLFFFLLN